MHSGALAVKRTLETPDSLMLRPTKQTLKQTRTKFLASFLKTCYDHRASKLSIICFHSYVRFDLEWEGAPCCSTCAEKSNKRKSKVDMYIPLPQTLDVLDAHLFYLFYVCLDNDQCNNCKQCSVDRNVTSRAWHTEDAYMGKARAARGKKIRMNDCTKTRSVGEITTLSNMGHVGPF